MNSKMTFSQMREHPNYEKIKKSVEFSHLKREMLILGIILGPLMLIVILGLVHIGGLDSAMQGARWAKLAGNLVLLVVMLLAMGGYYIYRLVELFSHIDRYTFCAARMDQPHQGYKGSMYFTVEVMDRRGNRIKRDTRKIFGQVEPNFEDYINRTALIAYNDETDTVVVIGLNQ